MAKKKTKKVSKTKKKLYLVDTYNTANSLEDISERDLQANLTMKDALEYASGNDEFTIVEVSVDKVLVNRATPTVESLIEVKI